MTTESFLQVIFSFPWAEISTEHIARLFADLRTELPDIEGLALVSENIGLSFDAQATDGDCRIEAFLETAPASIATEVSRNLAANLASIGRSYLPSAPAVRCRLRVFHEPEVVESTDFNRQGKEN